MRTRTALLAIAAVVALGACEKTEDGGIVVEKPTIGTTTDTVHPPTIGTRIDTITTPTIGTKPETLIVNKPVVGTKKTAVKVPVIRKP